MFFFVLAFAFLVCSCRGDFTNIPTLDPPAGAGCTLVGQSIYCIGGQNNHYALPCNNITRRLDLADFNFELIFTLNWTVSNAAVCTHDMVVSNVQTPTNTPGVFVFGGDSTFKGTALGYLMNPMDNSIIQTITDPTNSSLFTTFSSAGVTLPSGNVWMFGGENVFPSGGNWVAVSTSVLMYNVASNQMSVINTNSPGNATRVMHTATLAADGSAIYIIGGLTVSAFGAVPATQTNPADLNIWSFNLASSQWQTISPKLNSPNIGQGRSSHTATLLPHTTSILIFGGYQNSLPNWQAPNDYALIYDYAQNTLSDARPNFASQNLNDVQGNSAVLYTRSTGESFIFFLFGGPANGHLNSRVDILNVTTPSKMVWLSNNNSPPPSSGSQGSGPQASSSQGSNAADSSSSLSTSAIAGIAVGSVVAVFGVIGAFVLWFIGKKKNRQIISEALETDPRNDISKQQEDREAGTPDATTVVSDNQDIQAKNKPFEGSTVPSEDRTKPFESPEKPFEAHTQSTEASDKPVEWSTKPFEGLNKPFDCDPSQTK